MHNVKEVIVVEGRYDKAALRSCLDAIVLETDGFGVFSDREKLSLLRRLSEQRGVIILTDPDGGGLVIRNFLKSALGTGNVKQAYIPPIPGKEKRKAQAGKEGLLGVEGMSPEIILQALRRAGATIDGEDVVWDGGLTKADLYALGLSGGSGSAGRRRKLLEKLDLPEKLSSNALLEVLNALYDRKTLENLCGEL